MTEYELHYLIIEQRSLIMDYMTFWMTASTSVVLIGHFINHGIGSIVRFSILALYIFISFATIMGYLQCVYEALGHADSINELTGKIKNGSVIGQSAAYIGAAIYIAGAIGVFAYFLSVTKIAAKST
jgi:hypothetical protein